MGARGEEAGSRVTQVAPAHTDKVAWPSGRHLLSPQQTEQGGHGGARWLIWGAPGSPPTLLVVEERFCAVRQGLSGAHRDYLQSSRGEETRGLPSLGPSDACTGLRSPWLGWEGTPSPQRGGRRDRVRSHYSAVPEKLVPTPANSSLASNPPWDRSSFHRALRCHNPRTPHPFLPLASLPSSLVLPLLAGQSATCWRGPPPHPGLSVNPLAAVSGDPGVLGCPLTAWPWWTLLSSLQEEAPGGWEAGMGILLFVPVPLTNYSFSSFLLQPLGSFECTRPSEISHAPACQCQRPPPPGHSPASAHSLPSTPALSSTTPALT